MRLLTRTSLLITTISLFILFIGSIVFFQITRRIIDKQVNMELLSMMHSTMQNFDKNIANPPASFSYNTIIKRISPNKTIIPEFQDTTIYSTFEKKYIPNRVLVFTLTANRQNYQVEIFKSMLEPNTLLESITLATLVLAIVLIISIYFINRIIFRSIWRDFFTSLKKIENYDIKKLDNITLKNSEIIEFNTLNQVLTTLIGRIKKDFLNLKELTANTTHELQTPLAIIRSKAELLLQSDNLSENQTDLISGVLQSAHRLSKLNESLLLITKIENNQFARSEPVKMAETLKTHIENFQALIDYSHFQSDIRHGNIYINPLLLDVLLINLLKNAISYCNKKGEIYVNYIDYEFHVANSGKALEIPRERIFDRFVKSSENSESSGLGLCIVKKICDYYKLPVKYEYKSSMHHFTIDFSSLVEQLETVV